MCGIWTLHRKMLYIYYILYIIMVYLNTKFHMTRANTFSLPPSTFPPAQWKVNTQIHGRHHFVVYLKHRVYRSCIFYKALLTRKISDPYFKRHHSWTQLRRLHESDFDVIGGRMFRSLFPRKSIKQLKDIKWAETDGRTDGQTDKLILLIKLAKHAEQEAQL
jgi:hypothetical protein